MLNAAAVVMQITWRFHTSAVEKWRRAQFTGRALQRRDESCCESELERDLQTAKYKRRHRAMGTRKIRQRFERQIEDNDPFIGK